MDKNTNWAEKEELIASLNINGHVGDEGETIDEPGKNHEAVALSNHLILSKIFPHLNLRSIKAAREVCSCWNQLATPILGGLTNLQLLPLFRQTTNLKLIDHINPSLVRNVELRLYASVADEDSLPSDEIACKFATFTKKYHSWMEHISFIDYKNDGISITKKISPVLHSLQQLQFPSLKSMFLGANNCGCENVDEVAMVTELASLPQLTSPFPIRETMSRINCYLTNLSFDVEIDFLTPIFQRLLHSTPNLTCLKIGATLYPDLSDCFNLKKLEFYPFPFLSSVPDEATGRSEVLPNPKFSMPKLNKMLSQVQHGLKILALHPNGGFCFADEVENPANLLEIPIMGELVDLNISGPIYSPWKFLQPGRFPRLEQIENYDLQYEDIEIFLFATPQVMPYVNNLRIKGGRITENTENVFLFLERCITTFPNVAHLQIPFNLFGLRNPQPVNFLEDFLTLCEEWKVQKLELFVTREIGEDKLGWGRILESLRLLRIHAGVLRHIHFRYNCKETLKLNAIPGSPRDAEIDEFIGQFLEELLLIFPNEGGKIKYLIFENMIEKNEENGKWRRISEAVQDNGLPIHFRNRSVVTSG